jgi:hypothetical protein
MTNNNSHDELRTLWQDQPIAPFQMSPDELRLMIERQKRQFLSRTSPLNYAGLLLAVGVIAYFALFAWNALARIGFCLLIPAIGYSCLLEWRYVRERKASYAQAEALGNTGSLEFYRAVLEQEVNRFRHAWWGVAAVLPGFVILDLGLPSNPHGKNHWIYVCAILSVLLLGLLGAGFDISRDARMYERKIDALDALKRAPKSPASPFRKL